jgi:hypothetical protein
MRFASKCEKVDKGKTTAPGNKAYMIFNDTTQKGSQCHYHDSPSEAYMIFNDTT